MPKKKNCRTAIFAIILALLCTVIFSACGLTEERQNEYEEVLDLALEEVNPGNWVATGQTIGWGYETPNYHDQYYFYIDEDDYDDYKFDWLEDYPKENYYDGLNKGMGQYGDYMQHCINILTLQYETNSDYGGVPLEKNKLYYLVCVYDKAIYYKTVTKGGDGNFYVSTSSNVDDESLSRRIIFYKKHGSWVMETLTD